MFFCFIDRRVGSMRGQKFLERLRRILEYHYLPAVLAVFAVAISLPTLKTGWEPCDDLRHRVKLIEPSLLPERLLDTGLVPENSGTLSTILRDLHTGARTKDDIKRLTDYGTVPWWTSNSWRYSNWRPLDSFTHWLDYRLYPGSAAMIHAHSIIWFAAVILVVTILYRKLMSPAWMAGFAAFLYVLDESNLIPVGWIANRNLLISLVFGVLTLLGHHRWRTTNSLAVAILSVFCLLCSLLATEAGIAVFAYLFAYAVFLDRSTWFKRALSLAPYCFLILSWSIIYNALGHGIYGFGGIADPCKEPLRYAQLVLERFPNMIMGQLGPLPVEVNLIISGPAKIHVWLMSVFFGALVVVLLLPILRKNSVSRFWLLGMSLSILPICAVPPMSRHLLFAAIGAFGLVAQFISFISVKENWLNKSRWWQVPAFAVCIVFLLLHIPIPAAARIIAPKVPALVHERVVIPTMNIGSRPGLENQDVVIVNSPSPLMLFFMPSFRAHHRKPLPRAVWQLAPAFGPLEITRIDGKILLLQAENNNIFDLQQAGGLHLAHVHKATNGLFRHEGFRLQPGEQVALPRLTVEVVSVDDDGMLAKVLFHFAVPLEDSSLCWLQWDWEKNSYNPFNVPPIGEKCEIPGPFGQ
jgi:hypothetical protein